MRDRGLVAGVDCSTQGTKVLLVDPDSGEVVATGRAAHTVEGEGGVRETDPREWWDALGSALAQTGRAGEIAAISVAGQQHGLVVLDGDGTPLRKASLWNDTSAHPDADRLIERLGAETWAARTGLRPVASFTVAKWARLRRVEPEVARATAAIRLPHDYMTERLTGRAVTDRGDASGTGWWSPSEEAYAEDIMALPEVMLTADLLPELLGPTQPAGEVGPGGESLGLRPGTMVGPGTGDNMAAGLGLSLTAGQAAMSLGTSGTVYALSVRPSADPSGVVAGFADATGRFLPLAATLNCTLAVDRVAAWLGLDREDVSPAEGVVVLPYLDGERTPNLPAATGMISGLRHGTTRQQILMAAYEGAVASLLEALEAIGDSIGGLDAAAPLMLVGGGSRGAAWREVVRRLSGRPVLIPDATELVALGAAAQATAILRGEPPEGVGARWGTTAGTLLEPVPADRERLGRIQSVVRSAAATPDLWGGVG